MKRKNRYLYILCVTAFIVVTLFLAFNKHSKSQNYSYQSELWADKAGYYVYLPLAFKYSFNANELPDSIEVKTGNGFKVDLNDNKLKTKYSCGVAILQTPFYLLADALAEPLGFKANGFSKIYNWSINIAAVFYLFLGMFYLKKYLLFSFKESVVYLALLALFLATNLYYYAIDETGMSHVYSFSLFAIYLYLLQSTRFLKNINFWKVLIFGIITGMIILIRPTNILFLTTYFFLSINTKDEIVERLKRLFSFKVIIPIVLGVVLVFIPQLLYWKYTYGSVINYSYGNEGFNWGAPQLLKTEY